jgi:hypothetical protein
MQSKEVNVAAAISFPLTFDQTKERVARGIIIPSHSARPIYAGGGEELHQRCRFGPPDDAPAWISNCLAGQAGRVTQRFTQVLRKKIFPQINPDKKPLF